MSDMRCAFCNYELDGSGAHHPACGSVRFTTTEHTTSPETQAAVDRFNSGNYAFGGEKPDSVTQKQSEEWLRGARQNYEKAVGVDYYGRRTADGRGFAVVKEEAPAKRRRKWWRLWLW